MRQYAKGVPGGLLLLLSWRGSTLPRSALFGTVAAVHGCLMEHFFAEFTRDLFVHTYPYHVLAFVTGFGLVFRLQLSMQRYWEARSSMQAMAAKWGDAAIQVLAFDEGAEGEAARNGVAFRGHIVHLFSLLHCLAMDTLRGCMYAVEQQPFGGDAALDVNLMFQGSLKVSRGIDPANAGLREHYNRHPLNVLGEIDLRERAALQSSGEHVHLVMTWITRACMRRRQEGGIEAEAPVFSRVFQVLSDGMLHYMAALKIRDTPFPFPYAQANAMFCFVHLILFPVVVSSKVEGLPMTGILSGFGVMMIYAVNEVARELEDPYGSPACCFGNALRLDYLNDLFLARLLVSFCGNSAPHAEADSDATVAYHHGGDVSLSAHDSILVMEADHSGSTIAADYPVCSLRGQSSLLGVRPLPVHGDKDPAQASREGHYRHELIEACIQGALRAPCPVRMLNKRRLA